MTVFVAPEEGPFVFGAYATHLNASGTEAAALIPHGRLTHPRDQGPEPGAADEENDESELGSIAC